MNGKIAFSWTNTVNGTSRTDIWVMNPDGSAKTQLTHSADSAQDPAWSPDGTRIAFDSAGSIMVVNADGSGQKTLATGGASEPAWSPDGTHIAFARAGIVVMNADGNGATSLTNVGPGFKEDKPAWSPDGTKIAYNFYTGGGRGIDMINADGTGQANVPCGICYDPAWSPDGSRIAFGKGLTPPVGLYVMNPDGTNQTQLVSNPGGQAGIAVWPAWSPDATKIAFVASNGIFVVTAAGGAQAGLVGSSTAGGPAWQRLPGP